MRSALASMNQAETSLPWAAAIASPASLKACQTVAWQVAFLVISQDPVRYRLIMIPAVLEKAAFAVAAPVLFAQQRVSGIVLGFGGVDLVFGVLFFAAFRRTPAGID